MQTSLPSSATAVATSYSSQCWQMYFAIRNSDPFQRAHGPSYRLDRIARVLAMQPEIAS